jgi:hypothetical protein
MLDNTVGGSLTTGDKPINGMIRKYEEEICLDPAYTLSHIEPCGTLSFQLTVDDMLNPACQHQVQYCTKWSFVRISYPRLETAKSENYVCCPSKSSLTQ